MDSGNSGSLHSCSTGGDDEYDSRAGVSFLTAGGAVSEPPPLFDPFNNFINPFLVSPNTPITEPISVRPNQNPAPDDVINPFLSFQPPPPTVVGASTAAARNPRKRSRASRRAPTTVLTTDTANFRAMVQEFTGIPSSPFDLQRTRLDLYGSGSSSAAEPYPPPYLRRPLPRKPQSPPPFPHLSSANSKISSFPSTMTIPNSIDRISSHFLPISQPNSILASLLQTNPKFPSLSSMAESKPNSLQISSNHIKIDSLDEPLNTNPENHVINSSLASLQTLISSSNQISAANVEEYGLEARARSINGGFRASSSNPAGMVESWICSSSE